MAKTLISQAGTNAQSGYTLIELLVVMVILVFATALTPIAYQEFIPGARLNDATYEVLGAVKRLRSEARSNAGDKEFWLDENGRRYSGDFGQSWTTLPDGIDLLADTGTDTERENYKSVRFFENGGATQSRISLKLGNREKTIVVEWLTGRAQILNAP